MVDVLKYLKGCHVEDETELFRVVLVNRTRSNVVKLQEIVDGVQEKNSNRKSCSTVNSGDAEYLLTRNIEIAVG